MAPSRASYVLPACQIVRRILAESLLKLCSRRLRSSRRGALFQGAPLRLPKPLSDQFPVRDDDDVYPRETPPNIRTARASPQRHTAAGTAAPTTADTGNTVPQRATPTQTVYAHPRRRAQAQGQRLGTWTLVRPQKAPSADSTQCYHRKIVTSTITVPDVGLCPGFLPPRRARVYLPLNPLR